MQKPIQQKVISWYCYWNSGQTPLNVHSLPQTQMLDMQSQNIAAYAVHLQKRNCCPENIFKWVDSACQFRCCFQQLRNDFGKLMKCVDKVLIYHPKSLSVQPWFGCNFLHCCSLSWTLCGAWFQSVENCMGVAGLSLESCISISGWGEKLVWIDCITLAALQASVLWFETSSNLKPLLTCMLQCKRAGTETGQAPGF